MALHEVQLKGYNVRPGNLSLCTFGSYGIEQLHVTLDDTWSGLAVTATFNPPKGEPREIRLPENGLIDVPAEATANEGTGTIVYCGVANGVQRITKTQGYNVITRGPVGGTEPFKPSESLATQVLQAALNAETLRSIKREIGAGRDVAFWLDKAYTHYDNGLLDEADISEVEALAQAYYDALDAETVQDGNATNEQIQNPLYEEKLK